MIQPADEPPHEPLPSRAAPARGRRSIRGTLIVFAIFVLGGLVLWGLFFAARTMSPPPANDSPSAAQVWP